MNDKSSTLQASIEDRKNYRPQKMMWLYLERGHPRTPEAYMAFIEMPGDRYYGSAGKLEMMPGFGSWLQMPEQAFLRFEGIERYEAKNFGSYIPREDNDRQLPIGVYGRLYLAYPTRFFFTALLEPAVYTPSPPKSPLPTKQRVCCPFLTGGGK